VVCHLTGIPSVLTCSLWQLRYGPVMLACRTLVFLLCLALAAGASRVTAATALLPDGRTVAPAGFTIPVESFASGAALSPDKRWLAVVAQDAGAIDVIATRDSVLAARLVVPSATGLVWTAEGLYVAGGYSGRISRFAYDAAASKSTLSLTKRDDIAIGPGLLNGIAEDPATHLIAVARTADREVVLLDDRQGTIVSRRALGGQPFCVGFVAGALVATLYDGDSVAIWRAGTATPAYVATGPHPTALLVAGPRAFVADADGHDVVALDPASLTITARYDLSAVAVPPAGQTPAGMALSDDGATLFVTESGYNDVAVVDLASRHVRGRIPTAWYPMAVQFVAAAVSKKDARARPQLWIVSAQGLGSQADPAGEWNGTYTGLVSHVVVEPQRFAAWSADVRRYDRLDARDTAVSRASLPPVRHVVFIVQENKQFDEEFGDEPQADADPSLLLYGRRFTPNAHALAERYTLFDNFMGNGEASIYGHAWTTQGFANDYQERNAHARDESTANIDARVPWSIWPYAEAGEDTVPEAEMDFDWFRDLAQLPHGPRMNVSGVFGPRGELVDELARHRIAFRVYGEQLTMRRDGTISPGLVAHADTRYPGAHIDFGVLDTERARLFLDDVRAHGLPQYAYLTLPTDHTAGTKPGFYTPASYVASNDLALGQIIAGLSHRPEWKSTVVFVTMDDPQGTGDHVDDHRMPALLVGPYARHSAVDHTHYSIPSFLKTVEALFGLAPLNIEDAAAAPMLDAFARQPAVAAYAPRPQTISMERNPGSATSFTLPLDGPGAAAIAQQEWSSLRSPRASRSSERTGASKANEVSAAR